MGRKLKFVRRNKEETKLKILNAAIKVFATHSYDTSTFKMIETEAGVSETLITRYFASKRGLAIAIINKVDEDFNNIIKEVETKDNLHDAFHALGETLCEIFRDNSEKLTALASIASHDVTFIDEFIVSQARLSPDIEWMRKFQDNGDIPKGIDLREFYKIVLATIHSLLQMMLLTARRPYDIVTKLIYFNIDMLLYGISEKNRSLMELQVKKNEDKISP